MIVAGCDVGSLTSKAVIMKDGKIIGSSIIKSRIKPELSSEKVMEQALNEAGVLSQDVKYIIGTGYGRSKIPFIKEAVSEIACHSRGAKYLLPGVKTIIDIGGQDCKAIKIKEDGKVAKFITNDKCAAGTGRFLEVMASVLGVELDELGSLSTKAKNPITLASTCTVWSQADVIRHLNAGVAIEDIAAGISNSMSARVAILLNSVGVENDLCMTGGVAKNIGVLKALESQLGTKIKKIRKADPQLAGAIGAALFAMDIMN